MPARDCSEYRLWAMTDGKSVTVHLVSLGASPVARVSFWASCTSAMTSPVAWASGPTCHQQRGAGRALINAHIARRFSYLKNANLRGG
jgi:hypothetical protein